MGFFQRWLARRGYIRLADYGLVLTPYGVVRAHEPWQHEPGHLPDAPQPSLAAVLPAPMAAPDSSVSAAHLQASSAVFGTASARAESDPEGNTTLAQPLSNFRPPLAAETAPGAAAKAKWPQPSALATIMVDRESAQSLMHQDEDEKTVFSDPPQFAARTATPF